MVWERSGWVSIQSGLSMIPAISVIVYPRWCPIEWCPRRWGSRTSWDFVRQPYPSTWSRRSNRSNGWVMRKHDHLLVPIDVEPRIGRQLVHTMGVGPSRLTRLTTCTRNWTPRGWCTFPVERRSQGRVPWDHSSRLWSWSRVPSQNGIGDLECPNDQTRVLDHLDWRVVAWWGSASRYQG